MVRFTHTPKKMNKIVAKHKEVQASLEFHALEIAVTAEALLKNHRAEGVAEINVDSGKVDKYVYLDDKVKSNRNPLASSALSIETGRAGYIDQYGIHYGEMEGLWILSDAAKVRHKRNVTAPKRRDRKYTNRMWNQLNQSRGRP